MRVKNLRSIRDTKSIEIKPINIAVGSNSSGKSSFLRLFPLLRQSRDTRTTSPILWNGDYVDFGSFDESVRRRADKGKISLEFKFEKEWSRRPTYDYDEYLARRIGLPQKYGIKISTDISDYGSGSVPEVEKLKIKLCGQSVVIKINQNRSIEKISVNERKKSYYGKYAYEQQDSFLPNIEYKQEGKRSERRFTRRSVAPDSKLVEFLGQKLHSNTSRDTIERIVSGFVIGDDNHILESIRKTGRKLKSWGEIKNNMKKDGILFKKVRDMFIAEQIPSLVDLSNILIDNFSRGVNYTTPVRSRTDRYYRKQNLAFDELDPEGENLAIFLYNMTNTEKESFDKWTEEILGVKVKPRSQKGHLYITIDEDTQTQADTEYNLVDAGFGFTQVLPIVTQLWAVTRKRRGSYRQRQTRPSLCAIEQPELHLHPKLQARIADALVKTVDESRTRESGLIPLIVETHSEAIVNRLGHLISEDYLSSDDVQVLLFERENPSLSSISYSSFDDDGYLTDWPVGFFGSGIIEE